MIVTPKMHHSPRRAKKALFLFYMYINFVVYYYFGIKTFCLYEINILKVIESHRKPWHRTVGSTL